MRKWTILLLVVIVATCVVPAFTQQDAGDYIVVKKSDLPPLLLKKLEAKGSSTTVVPIPMPMPSKYYFLMSGWGMSVVFTEAGPFKTETECKSLNEWAKKNGSEKVSACWAGE